uniref:Ephrin RBD domain-containing protein n=1 Tax=Trichobilharzia regenti TaxID=157069 RepID=A0AA85JX73_TRIRE|nr:unnamed protein product [Trichobilharzia regenti]
MLKACIVDITFLTFHTFVWATLQDHLILWDASNWRFQRNQNEMYVNEGDNLIFICPTNRTFSQNLFWTSDSRVQLECEETTPIKVVKLLDCFGDDSASEFVLKVSRFPEIVSLPSFQHNIPVHFVAQSVVCQKNNFRLSVKLAAENMATNPNVTSPVSIAPAEKSQSTSHSKKYIDHEVVSVKNPRWLEYRFLLLSGILAFSTLIGMQIVLCSFWLPNSVTNRILNCLRKCKQIPKTTTYTNQIITDKNKEDARSANSNYEMYALKGVDNSRTKRECLLWNPSNKSLEFSNINKTFVQACSTSNCFSIPYYQTYNCVIAYKYQQSNLNAQNFHYDKSLLANTSSNRTSSGKSFSTNNSIVLFNCPNDVTIL